MFKIGLGVICAMCVGYLGGLAQNRNESYKAYHKGRQDGKNFVMHEIEIYSVGKENAYKEIKEILEEKGLYNG